MPTREAASSVARSSVLDGQYTTPPNCPSGNEAMTTRKELAQKLEELPAFNLRFGSRVDIFNLPTEDRDLIVRSLREVADLADKGQNIAAEFEKLREKILALTVERDEVAGRLGVAAAENAKLAEQGQALAANNARLEEMCRSLTADHQPLEEKIQSLTAESSALTVEKTELVSDRDRLAAELRALTADLAGAVDVLLRLVNGEADFVAVAAFLHSRFPDKAGSLRPPTAHSGRWQPILTAPRDNSLVNLIGRPPDRGRWVAPVASRRNMISADAGVDQWLDWEHPFAPTHWCPIPPAPSDAEAPSIKGAAATCRPPGEQAWPTDDRRFVSQSSG
jgi:hypothetical protein